MGMAYGFNFCITLDGCNRFLALASSDHCTAIRVELSDPVFWTLREEFGVVQTSSRGSESRVASAVVAFAGEEQAGGKMGKVSPDASSVVWDHCNAPTEYYEEEATKLCSLFSTDEVMKLCSFLDRRSCEKPRLQHSLVVARGALALTKLRLGAITLLAALALL